MPSGEVPLFYRRGFRNVLQQAIYVAATAIIAWYVYTSLDLREFGFGFLSEPAGFAVGSQWLTEVDGVTNSRLTMYLVGVWSSIRAVLVAILLSTIVGVVVGVARLSSNFLVSKMAMLFVEIFRNTPLLVQVVLWYAILLVGAPIIQNVVNVGDFFFLSNRGIAIPWPVPSAGLWGVPDWFVGVWVIALIAAALVALRVRAARQERERETGQPHFANRYAFTIFAAAALISFLLLGVVVSIDRPILEGTQYAEGMVIKPEFAALVLGLTAYTGSFIAEIVRGSIQALPRGQTEAANAIGALRLPAPQPDHPAPGATPDDPIRYQPVPQCEQELVLGLRSALRRPLPRRHRDSEQGRPRARDVLRDHRHLHDHFIRHFRGDERAQCARHRAPVVGGVDV